MKQSTALPICVLAFDLTAFQFPFLTAACRECSIKIRTAAVEHNRLCQLATLFEGLESKLRLPKRGKSTSY